MPVYKIQGPDNHVYQFEGPADASTDEQIAYAQHMYVQRHEEIARKQNKSFMGDIGTKFKQGVERLPGAAVGLADIPVSLIAGKPVLEPLATKAGEMTGFQPSQWAAEAEEYLSPAYQQGQQEIAKEQGFGNIAKSYLTHPRQLAGLISEAIPMTAAAAVTGGAAGAGLGVESALGRAAVSGLGEGAVTAGSMYDQLIQGGMAPEEARRKAISAAGAGAITGGIGAASSRLAARLGVVDPESIFNKPVAQALTEAEINQFMNVANRGIAARVGIGAAKEGLLEELPQGIQEQMWQNYAERKPIMQDVSRAAVESALAGTAMGGGVNLLSKGMTAEDMKAEIDRRTNEKATEIAKLQAQMANQAMGGTPESRAYDSALAAQGVEDKEGREAVRAELARPIYQTKEEVTAVLDNLRALYPELDQKQLNQTRIELQQIRETLPSQAEAAKALIGTKPTVAPTQEPTAKPAPVINPLVIDDNMLDQWGVTGRNTRNALKEYGDLTNPEHVAQVQQILTELSTVKPGTKPPSNAKLNSYKAGLDHLLSLQTQGAPNVETQTPTSGGVQTGGARPAPVGQGTLPGMELPNEPAQAAPQEVTEPGRGGVGDVGGIPSGDVEGAQPSAAVEPSPLTPESTEVIQPEAEVAPIEVKPVEEVEEPKRNLVKDIKAYQAAIREVDPEIAKDVDDLLAEYNEAKKGGRKNGVASPHLSTAEQGLRNWMAWADKQYPDLNMPALLERGRKSRSATSVDRLNAAFDRLFTPNLLAVKRPHIFASSNEIPEPLRSQVEGAMAFVTPRNQQEHYIADKIPKGEEIATILHEKGVHLGMPKLIGRDRLNALSNRVVAWATEKGDKLENKIARDAVRRANSGVKKSQIGGEVWKEETVAYFADLAVHKYGIDPLKDQPKEFVKIAGWLRELWNGVLSTIRKLNYNPEALTAHEIVSMVYGAARIEMHEDYQGRPNTPESVNAPAAEEGEAPEVEAKMGIPGLKKPEPKRMTDAERQAAKEAGRQVYEEPVPLTLKERLSNQTKDKILGWLAVKLVGGGESLALKGTKMFGPEARLNPATGKELGYLNYHRALHDNDLATGAAQFGYLEMDKEGVFHVRDSDENVVALNGIANKIKAQMMADGMSEAAADDAFAHMMLADRFKVLQREGILSELEFSKGDQAYGQELKQKYKAGYDEFQNMYQTIRARTMNSLVESGTFSKAKAKEFLDRFEYIPFNRAQEDDMASDAVFLRSLLSAKGEHHIKGSKLQVKNVMDNIVDNQVWLLKRAVRNNASNLVADTMEEMHRINPLMGGYETVKGDKSPNVISYLKDGELRYFKVLDPNDAAIFASAPAVGNSAIRIMRMFTGYLRKGVTLMPSFHYGQIIQDAMRAPAVAGTKSGMAGLLKTSAPEFWKNIKGETPLARDLRRAGIVGQIDYQDTYDNWRKEVLGAKRTGMGNVLERAERIAQANDLATRAAVYNDVLKQTGNENEASLRALMMINFQNRGHSQVMNTLMATVPFVNSRIQGEYRLLMALTGKIPGVSKQQAKQLIAWRAAKMAAFTMIYAMASGGDDDYETAGEEVKNHNFLFNGIKVPVAPEFLPLKVGVEKAYRLMTDQEFESGAKAARAELSAVAGLFMGAGDLTPTMLKPLIENMTNYSFFTGHNLVGFNQMSKDVNLRFNEGTSDFSKGVSDFLQALGGNTINISPIKLDNLIRGWFGTMGKDFLYTVDMIAGDKPMTSFNQLPLAGGMFYNMQGGALKSDFYDLKDEADRAYNTLNDLKKNDPEKAYEYYQEYQPLIAIHSRLNAIGQYLDHARKEKQYIIKTDPENSAERVNELNARVNEMLKNSLPPIMNYLAESDAR